MNGNDIASIVASYGIAFGKLREDIPLFGSPERTEYRVAFEDTEGRSYIFEKVAEARLAKKRAIARTLSALSVADPSLPIAPYVRSAAGEHVLEVDGRHVQVVPYIEGVALDRECYLGDDWRGVAAAEFLIAMRRASASLLPDETGPIPGPFLLREYVAELVGKIRRNEPDLLEGIDPVLSYLDADFFPQEHTIPTAFCHGDYHPVNVIWSERSVAGVIDWEFAGPKAGLYDVANMVGCLGMEDPDALKAGIVTEFLRMLRESDAFSGDDWNGFPDLLLATRFAWLSEWLRFKERGLIALEAEYMNLILENRDFLTRIWNIA
ncbi:MAG: aminoglycoside phosphotransferase family protein [Candidatus Moranbacteria bacterium]|nr:aminoglycoside phosphotransferase family protein [Candidatus Moranbacteria bacterium]